MVSAKITFLLLFFTQSAWSYQQVAARIRPIWAPILSPELKAMATIQDGQYVYFDPDANDYVIRYVPKDNKPGDVAKTVSLGFSNQADVDRTTSIAVTTEANKGLRYEWSFVNRASSKAPIRSFWFAVPKSDTSLACTGNNWGRASVQPSGLPSIAHQISTEAPNLKLSLGDFRFLSLNARSGDYLRPGSSSGVLDCLSTYLPGWVSVYMPAGLEARLPDDVPQAAHDQLGKMLKMEHHWSSTIDFGPKYPSDAPLEIIAFDFLTGLSAMASIGLIDEGSKFSIAIKEQLTRIAESPSSALTVQISSDTQQELEVLNAVKLSLPKHFR